MQQFTLKMKFMPCSELKMKIVYKHQAVLDIRQTQEYIAETLGNKRAAQKLVASILKAISLLEENPMMGVSMGAKFEIKLLYVFL